MFDKFKDEFVYVKGKGFSFNGTLHKVYKDYFILLVVNKMKGTLDEVIINKKKVHYISRCVKQIKISEESKS